MQEPPKKAAKLEPPKFYTADGVLIRRNMTLYIPVPAPYAPPTVRVVRVTTDGPVATEAACIFHYGRIAPGWTYSSSEAAGRAAAFIEQLGTLDPSGCACSLCWALRGGAPVANSPPGPAAPAHGRKSGA